MKRNLFEFPHYDFIRESVGELQQDEYYHFFDNRFYLHELLLYIFSFTGPAEVCLTNFSLSEIGVRTLMNLKDNGYLKGLTCLLDSQVERHKTGLMLFAANIADQIAITKNHAKIILFENYSWTVVLNGSANLTVNPRFEAGMICTKPDVYYKYKTNFYKVFNESTLIK